MMDAAHPPEQSPVAGASRARLSFMGHPWGLAVLAGTEIWISFSYYGMQSLLVLYMAGQLLRPGHVEHVLGFGPFRAALQALYGPLASQPLASAIAGVFGAAFYATRSSAATWRTGGSAARP